MATRLKVLRKSEKEKDAERDEIGKTDAVCGANIGANTRITRERIGRSTGGGETRRCMALHVCIHAIRRVVGGAVVRVRGGREIRFEVRVRVRARNPIDTKNTFTRRERDRMRERGREKKKRQRVFFSGRRSFRA